MKYCDHNTAEILKQYCNTLRKLANEEENLKFNLECKNYGIIPKYMENSLKTVDSIFFQEKSQRKLSKCKNFFMHKIMNIKVSELNDHIRGLKQTKSILQNQIKEILNQSEYTKFFKQQNQAYINTRKKKKVTHTNKLELLKELQFEKFDFKLNDKFFINNTHIVFPKESIWLLSLGNKFALPTTKENFSIIHTVAEIEFIVQRLKIEQEEKDKMRNKVTNRLSNYKRNLVNSNEEKFINKVYKNTKIFLKKHEEEVILTNADKGNITVIMYREEYMEKMKELLEDKTTYRRIRNDPTEDLIEQNNKFVLGLYKTKIITKEEKRFLACQGAKPPQIYGQPKIHKPEVPLRPIIASTEIPCRNMAKYIGRILKNLVSEQFNIKNTYNLKQQLQQVKLEEDEILVSFDAKSLFTNIPTEHAKNIIMKKWNEIETQTKIAKGKFREILNFCLKDNNYFLFDDKIYKQTHGLPMGNPLAPTIADIVLDDILTKLNENLNNINIKPKYLTKYVDDILAIIKKDEVNIILEELNKQHERIQFTIEIEDNGSIAFLDSKIFREGENLIMDWYAKSTASGRMMNFKSNQHISQKINTATNFIKKVFTISDDRFKQKNKTIILDTLKQNNFPVYLINNLIEKYEKNINEHVDGNTNTIESNTTQNKKFFSLTYHNNLDKEIKKILANDEIKIASKPNDTNRKLFKKIKSKTTVDEYAVTYEIKCLGNQNENCKASYVGTTMRRISIRLSEHNADYINKRDSTALSTHLKQMGHKADFFNATILDREKNYSKRFILEGLRIQQKRKYCINKREDVACGLKFYSSIL